MFDPKSSTLYVDSHLANSLRLDDGTSVELPTDVLLNSINNGQVQVINSNNRMDHGSGAMDQNIGETRTPPPRRTAIKAQITEPDKKKEGPFYALNARHESIRDLLHFQSQQQFRPNIKEQLPPQPKGKVWFQINQPSRAH